MDIEQMKLTFVHLYDQLEAGLRQFHPGHTDEWYAKLMELILHVVTKPEDVAGRPVIPGE